MEDKKAQYLWVLGQSYVADGEPFILKPEIYSHKKDAKEMFDYLRDHLLNEYRNHKIINKTETDDTFYLVAEVNNRIDQWGLYIKRAKVVE